MAQPGHPLQWENILPKGYGAEDAYTFLAGLAAFLCIYSIGKLLVDRDKLAPRLKALEERRTQLKSEYMSAKRRKHKQHDSIHFMRRVVSRFKLLKKDRMASLSLFLLQAGWRSKDAMIRYSFFKLVAPVGLLFLALLMIKFDFSDAMDHKWKLLLPFGAVYFGYRLPDILVTNQRQKRWKEILKGLPDTLDLMMICAEAGLSLAAALDRVARELGNTYPELAEELTLTSIELGFYPDRKKALTNLGERVGITEVRGMVSVLLQTEKYGTPISQALRALASEFRTQRMLRAEQKAARLPAIMTVPMILFILPCLFIVVMAPAFIQLADNYVGK